MNIPIENKHHIQSCYVRYRELSQLAPEVGKRVALAQWCFWGGIGLFIVWIIRGLIDNSFSSIPAGFAIAAFLIGLFLRSDSLEKQRSIWAQTTEIEKQMQEIGVIFSGFNTSITAYYQEVASESEFNPMRDTEYS